MPRSISSANSSGYDASDDLRLAEYTSAVVLYILGLDGDQQNAYEVDDVINAIHTSFNYVPINEDGYIEAHGYFMKKHSAMLKAVYRKANATKKFIDGAQKNV